MELIRKVQALTAADLVELLSSVPKDTPVFVYDDDGVYTTPALKIKLERYYGVRAGRDEFYSTEDGLPPDPGEYQVIEPAFDAVLISPSLPEA